MFAFLFFDAGTKLSPHLSCHAWFNRPTTRYAKLAFHLDRQVTELEKEKAELVAVYRGLRSEYDQLKDYSVHQNKILTQIQHRASQQHGGVNMAPTYTGRLVDAPIYGNATLEATDAGVPPQSGGDVAQGHELLGNWPVMVAGNSTVADGALGQRQCWASVSTTDVALLDKVTMQTIISWPFDAVTSYATERQVISIETTGPDGGLLFLVTNPATTKDFFNALDYAGELN